MPVVTLKGQPIHTSGDLPKVGKSAPAFHLTKTDLSDVALSSFTKKRLILNIFPSLDTATCALSVRTFNQKASELSDVVVLCISMDLPFAQNRFCGAEGLNNVIPLSAFRHVEFGQDYGVLMTDGKLAGLFARAVVIIDAAGIVTYTQLVKEISEEPDYTAALAAATK